VPPDHARILEAKLPQSRTILFDECGHLPQLEQPGQFNAAVLDFLSGEDMAACFMSSRPSKSELSDKSIAVLTRL
jgi:hypothetical protein